MNYLLDTNIISELTSKNPNSAVLDFINSLDEKNVFLSVITIGEIKAGIEKVKDVEKKEKLSSWLTNNLLSKFQTRIITIDIDIMLTWGLINNKLKNIGKPLPILDSIIGSTCICKNLVLITRNEKDFQNLNITIINPYN